MPIQPYLLAPLALLLPFGMPGASGEDAAAVADTTVEQTGEGERSVTALPLSEDAPAWTPLFDGISPSKGEQVRIERRVILRISPAPGPTRQNFNAESSQPAPRTRLVEKRAGDCINTSAIRGVADRGDHLLMLMRDRTMMTARLEKGCSPRDFYRGFYMERSEDGQLCVGRDRLMSRSGAKCQVRSFHRVVAEPAD